MNRIKYLWIAAIAAGSIILYSCGGGFGTDSGNSREIGIEVFGPDTIKRR